MMIEVQNIEKTAENVSVHLPSAPQKRIIIFEGLSMASKCREDDVEALGDLIELQKVFVDLASERLKEDPGSTGVLGTYQREVRKLKFLQRKLAAIQGIELSSDWDKEEPSSIIPSKANKGEAVVKDESGRWVGYVRRHLGKAVLSNRTGQVIAVYDSRTDRTLGADGRLIGTGNRLLRLVDGADAA
jgi:hypothetical protein